MTRYLHFARIFLELGPDTAVTRWWYHVQLGGPYVRRNDAREIVCAVRYGALFTEMYVVGDVSGVAFLRCGLLQLA